mgnify:CR=1 FL=1
MKKCFKGVAKGMAAALTLAVVISAVSFSPVITYAASPVTALAQRVQSQP